MGYRGYARRARAEAHRLGAGRFTLDRPLVLALLRRAAGDPAARARAKECSTLKSVRRWSGIVRLARIRKLRTSLLANHAASASENQESGCVAHHRDVPFARRNVF